MTEAEISKLSARNRAAQKRPMKDALGKGPHGPVSPVFMTHFYGGVIDNARGSAGERALAQQLRAIQLHGWQCEYRFDAKRRWRLDFAWPDRKLAVEVEGGIWTDGRHTRGSGFEADCEKYAHLAISGWRLIRCTPGQIKSGVALSWIREALCRSNS